MKTGRLLKFPRGGGTVQAYIYREGEQFEARLYWLGPGRGAQGAPVETLSGASEEAVENAVRQWVDVRFPRRP